MVIREGGMAGPNEDRKQRASQVMKKGPTLLDRAGRIEAVSFLIQLSTHIVSGPMDADSNSNHC